LRKFRNVNRIPRLQHLQDALHAVDLGKRWQFHAVYGLSRVLPDSAIGDYDVSSELVNTLRFLSFSRKRKSERKRSHGRDLDAGRLGNRHAPGRRIREKRMVDLVC
jgi:hypothetical protein